MPRKRIFIIAGEVSGDVLGAAIMRAAGSDAEFIGIGGENMRAAGLCPIFPMSDLAVMGVIEVVAHARTLTRRIRQTVDAILDARPDMVITIDSPGFAQSVIKKVRKSSAGRKLIANGMEFRHVVAPQVWAWRAGRAKKHAKLFDKLYAFFEFEVPYFTKYGLNTVAVGHPIAATLPTANAVPEKIITLLPGSRMSEVRRLMPLMRDVVSIMHSCGYDKYKFVIPTVETTDAYIREMVAAWPVPVELVPSASRYEIFAKTYVAIAASGTVSAELAMMHVPAIVVYKMNPITMWLARRLVRLKWVSLVNIMMNRTIYPELLGADATAENIMTAVRELGVPANRAHMVADLVAADGIWRHELPAAELIANDIIKKFR